MVCWDDETTGRDFHIEFMIFFQTIVARMLIAGRWRTSASKLCKRLLGGGGRE